MAKVIIVLAFCLIGISVATASQFQKQKVDSEFGCLKCGDECLSAVSTAVPSCIAAALDVTTQLFSCVKGLMSSLGACKLCIESLTCCVTDSCSICDCDCHNLVQFTAPSSSPTFLEHPWLFHPQCHFAYIGDVPCEDCDGKRSYKSVNCTQNMYLHYHDYLIDGRWVVNDHLDKDDKNAVVRNRGDGLDDEECPEKETYTWAFRSKKAPGGAGWHQDDSVSLKGFNIDLDGLIVQAKRERLTLLKKDLLE